MHPSIRGLVVALAASSAVALAHADSSNTLVRFEGAIGVDPLTAANGSDALNIVRGVNPGGRAWVIRQLHASIGTDGRISVRGAGLLLASGDVIGTRAGIAQVIATLACGPASAAATLFHSPPAALDTAGNFRISGALTQDGVNAAVLPATCDNPALLIRAVTATGTPGVWFAAGIVGDGDRDDD
jgi:hypothetical protein